MFPLLFSCVCLGQTTQGLISGRLVDSRTSRPVASAAVSYANAATNISGSVRPDEDGRYYLPLLSPGFYRIRVEAAGYQSREVYDLELPVAARLTLNFRMRPAHDVWETGQYRSVFLPGSRTIVTFYGPDVDTSRSGSFEAQKGRTGALESTVSYVIDSEQIRKLPLAGRDVYAMLATQPGVTADSGTSRGLGLSVNGQRPSASNFLLDGLENNNYLVTGPLTAMAPEVIQEYRIATNNYSAEYGRASGFIANAVTRAGGSDFHGIVYSYLKNEALNANGFQENLRGRPRSPLRENQTGFQAGGPILKQKLFFSSAYEHFRSRGRGEPVEARLPSPAFAANYTAPSSVTRRLLEQHAPPVVQPDSVFSWFGTAIMTPPVSVDRSLAIQRLDYRSGSHYLMGRVALARVSRPGFIWTPYPDFASTLEQNTYGAAVTYQRTLSPGWVNEAKAGYNLDTVGWDRPHPEIPTLASADGVFLPGSPAFYAYRNRSRTWEFLNSLIRARGAHVVTLGGGLLLRSSGGFLTAGRDGFYLFPNVLLFGADSPSLFSVSADRAAPAAQPEFDRDYRYRQSFFFVQDTLKAAPRLVLNLGLRYERFGSPRSAGAAKDMLVELGSGTNPVERLAAARLESPDGSSQTIYRGGGHNWAGRFGISYDLTGSGRSVLRAAYGIFYDRPFDNLWQNVRNNRFVLRILPVTGRVDYLAPPSSVPASNPTAADGNFPPLTMFDPNFRNGYSQNYFFGVQQRVADSWTLEVNGLGALGRRLITTDIVNREFTTPLFPGRPNEALPDILYRAGQGLSNYHALSVVSRYRSRRAQFQAAYTWSHAIDNQSDALTGDFFDLSFTRIAAGGGRTQRATFARQFDSRADRGNSDFDQRHNLVFLSVWDLPPAFSGTRLAGVFRNWTFSQLAAFRTGFPYSVYGASDELPDFGKGIILSNRANLIDSQRAVISAAAPGGRRLLDAGGFSVPGPNTLGNTARNAFRGPGLYNVDLSVGRSFAMPWFGESGRLTLRADAFNFLNHANLNNPPARLGETDFGVALYGRRGRDSGFPAVAPFQETARQVQLLLRVEW